MIRTPVGSGQSLKKLTLVAFLVSVHHLSCQYYVTGWGIMLCGIVLRCAGILNQIKLNLFTHINQHSRTGA